MSKCKGTVTACGKGKFSFFITLKERDGFYFNTKYEPKCGVGDVVGIEFEKKADNRGNVKKVTLLEDNGGKKGVQSAGGSGGGAASGERQDSIIWQHSQEMALSLVGLLIANEAFALKGKSDAKRVQIEELLDELTTRLFKDASNPKKSKAFTGSEEIEKDSEGGEEGGKDEWDDDKDGGDTWDD